MTAAPMCKHRPISNGWGGGLGCASPPTTWCGYCKTSVLLDEPWAEKYFDAKRRRVLRDIERGVSTPAALEEVERQRQDCVAAVREQAQAVA